MNAELRKFPFNAMASSCEVQLFAPSNSIAEDVAHKVIAEVRRIEEKFSRYRPESIVSQINAAAGSGINVGVDSETSSLLNYASAAFKESDGLFDITSGVLRRVWNFKERRKPTADDLRSVLPLIGWQKVHIDDSSILLPDVGMEIDLGGIGKEYAVDRAVGIAVEYKNLSGLVNLGGDIRVFGNRPDKRSWSVGISHPRKEGSIIAYVPIPSGALATSGDYERFMEIDGERYCHILNPRTGHPVNDLQSVSVYAQSCLVAGTLATVTMLRGAVNGERSLRQAGVKAMLIQKSGNISTIG